MIFTWLAISDKTKIQPHLVENPLTCATMWGFDANSLYLHAIMQKNPTGYFCWYQEKEGYHPHPTC